VQPPLIATHDQWFSDFFRFAAESDAGIQRRWFQCLIALLKGTSRPPTQSAGREC
jgi:hypothetical protein